MARSLRVEYPGAVYHVLNRGNYRKPVFETPEARDAFEACLFGACDRYGWRLYAYCTLSNHYHCALETTETNLSVGMQWLQSTFANRFNRAHQAHGHLFQGRFKSLIVERDEYLGPLIHYIHLNPIRANLATMDKPDTYRWSSLWYLDKKKRPVFMDLSLGLHYAGNLADTPKGRRQYKAYLAWLQEDNTMKRRLQFSSLCRGWALGSKTFKEELVEKYLPVGSVRHLEGADFQEANQVRWEAMVKACMKSLGKTKADVQSNRKAALWKVMIACSMKERTSVSNVWLAKTLNMGVPQGVSRSVGQFKKSKGQQQKQYIKLLRITA
jgi:REP element-mobilizing transposase RayT